MLVEFLARGPLLEPNLPGYIFLLLRVAAVHMYFQFIALCNKWSRTTVIRTLIDNWNSQKFRIIIKQV